MSTAAGIYPHEYLVYIEHSGDMKTIQDDALAFRTLTLQLKKRDSQNMWCTKHQTA